LKYLGYEVEVRTSSQDALDLFKNDMERFDLVIMDMTMPIMTGDRLAREMLQLRKDLPIILCTGYSARITEAEAKELGVREFMSKPMVIGELAYIIRKVLQEKNKYQTQFESISPL
jgi:two-component system cell cycle sensor histidine kinase/response regulator CckA